MKEHAADDRWEEVCRPVKRPVAHEDRAAQFGAKTRDPQTTFGTLVQGVVDASPDVHGWCAAHECVPIMQLPQVPNSRGRVWSSAASLPPGQMSGNATFDEIFGHMFG